MSSTLNPKMLLSTALPSFETVSGVRGEIMPGGDVPLGVGLRNICRSIAKTDTDRLISRSVEATFE
jgi:hypothetical protein